jgi:hypothetical protein
VSSQHSHYSKRPQTEPFCWARITVLAPLVPSWTDQPEQSFGWHFSSLPPNLGVKFLCGSDKGIDVHIAFDVTRLAVRSEYDVAGVFSQDQDLSGAGDEVRVASKLSGSWIGIACADPIRPTIRNKGGINHSERIPIGRKT